MVETIDNIRNRRAINNWTVVVICFCVALGLGLAPKTTYAMNSAAYTYENPRDIVISQPTDGYKTASQYLSIFGSCDWEYPLYMNGTKIATTEHGFFSQYVELKIGLNTFTFMNNGKSKTVNITRNSGSSSSSSGSATINYWGASHTAKYATVKGQNISRMRSPNSDEKELLMPLATGTVAQIIGETNSLYCLSDCSLVYKSNVMIENGTLGKNMITEATLVPETQYNCTELQFKMNQNSLYNLEMGDERAILTICNTYEAVQPKIIENRVIKSVDILSNTNDGTVIYSINFHENAPLNGYYVEFADGTMKVGFKQLPSIKNGSLKGVRIHIDAGHGGTDTGALGPMSTYGPIEKDINLSIALYAKEYLESKGATVIMTREGDTATALTDRAANVAALKPDFSLSVHCNSMPLTADYSRVSGFLTFYSFDDNGAANYINNYITSKMNISKSTSKFKNLAMTRMTGYPAVLFETAFMSNPQDYEWMIKQDTQQQFGVAAGEALEGFMQQISEPNISIAVDGFELESVQPAIIKSDRTLLPLRTIFESLGATVEWNNDTQTVVAEKDNIKMSLPINSDSMQVYQDETLVKTYTLDVPAQLIADRTYVPVRAVSEVLEADVKWDGENQTVIITTK